MDEAPPRKKVKLEQASGDLVSTSKAHLANQQPQLILPTHSSSLPTDRINQSRSIDSMKVSPQSRKRSNSLPHRSNYNAYAPVPVNRVKRVFHHDMNTTYGSKVDTKKVIEMIRMEMKTLSLDISTMVLERFSRMLPGSYASYEQLKAIRTLFVQPMLLSNSDLGLILRLEPLNRKEGPRKGDECQKHVFYIRSWVFTPAQLYNLSNSMQEAGHKFSELDEWKFISFTAGLRNLTVRYIGTAESRKHVFRRFRDDLGNRTEKNLLGAFQHCLEQIYPQIFHNVGLHLITDMSLEVLGNENNIGNQLNADDTESILILFFRHHSLLNVQHGGQHIRYLSQEGDEIIFKSLHTKYFRNFLNECSPFPEDRWLSVASQFTSFVTGIPGIDEHSRKAVIGTLEGQMKPYQYCGTTAVVFLGEKLSDQHFTGGDTFFNGPSKTSRFVRNFVHRIKNIEENYNCGTYEEPLHDLSKAFPFLNAVPLPNNCDPINSLQFLATYFQCTRPIVVVTFGKQAASAIISNLTAINHQLRGIDSLFARGAYKLATYSYGADENDVFIHIPLNHPASYQYGSRSPDKLRLFYIGMQFSFYVASCTINAIKKYSECHSTPSRKALCLEVKEHVETHGSSFRFNLETAFKAAVFSRGSDTHLSTKYFEYLEKASSEWFESQRSQTEAYIPIPLVPTEPYQPIPFVLTIQNPKTPTAHFPSTSIELNAIFEKKQNGIAILDESNFRHILSFGVAVGEAGSEERRRKLQGIWSQNRQELHCSIPHSEDTKEIWIEQFMSLQPGQSYFLRALSQVEDCDYLPTLIRNCRRPSWHPILPTEESETSGVLDEAVIKCGFWVQRKLITKTKISLLPSPFVTTAEMQSYPIGIKDNGIFTLRWKHPSGSNESISITARFAVPQNSRDSRAVSFTEHGIDIVDASGNPLRPSRGTSRASIPKEWFRSRPSGQLIFSLWKAVREEYGHDVEEKHIEGSREWSSIKGQKYLHNGASKEEISEQNCPPLENDANFLLVAFLDERFPDGGIFRTAPKEKFSDSTEDLQAFIEFCQRPEYVNHPYSSKWVGSLDRETPLVSILWKNISVYRDCKKQNVTQRKLRELRFHIGPKRDGLI